MPEIGYHQKAMKLFKEAEPFVKSMNCQHRKILYYSSLADLYLSLGNKKESMLYLKKAMADVKKLKNKTLMATVMNNIGNVMMSKSKYKNALKIYTKAFSLINHSKKDDVLKSALLINILSVRMWTGSFDDTLAYLNKSIAQTRKLPDSHVNLNYMTSLSYKILQLSNILVDIYGDLDQIAKNVLTQTIYIAQKSKDYRLLAKNFGYMGKYYEQKKDLENAIQCTQKAIFYADQGKKSETLYLWLWQLARLYNHSEDKEKAIKLYQESIEKLSGIRKELFTGYRFHKDIFNEKIKPVYQELVGLFIDMAENQSNKDLKGKYLRQALETMEHLKSAELRDYFQDECVAKNKQKSTLLSHIPDKTALLYPISLPDQLIILVCISDHIKYYSRPMSKEYFNKTVTNYRKQLQTRYSNHFLKTSNILYTYLIAPAQKDLNKNSIHTILVSCGGKLRMIPFSTLHDGEKFLIEKYAIATIPAINLTEIQAKSRDKKEILLSGLSDAVQDFSALPSVKEELNSIQLTMKSENVLFNKNYTKSNLKNEIKNKSYSIIHLATHGVFAGTAEDSYLLTYDDKINMNDLEELLSIGKYTLKQIDLLTLSACQTALGNERAALGLAGVAVKAGVKTAIATLWYVDDEATSKVVREMYKQLTNPEISKVKALQNAQKALISQSKYWHPVYWAPFLLIGNWG